MKPAHPQHWLSAAVVSLLALCGCTADYYRAETQLHSGGEVERAIYQPVGQTPEAAQQDNLWQGTQGVDRIESDAWSGPIAELPPATGDDSPPYFAGWGKFASVDKIPDHYVMQSPYESRHSRLVRQTERTDLVFVTEHRWHETLTDIVTLDDLQAASRELADVVIRHVDDVLTGGLDKDYDHEPLILWMKGEGTEWFIQMAETWYELGATQQFAHVKQDDGEQVKRRFEAVAARHGLKRLEGEAIAAFAEAKLGELVLRQDGQPADAETIDSILIWQSLKEVKDANGDNKTSPLEAVSKEVIAAKHGGEEAFSRKIGALVSRICGVYGPISSPRNFDYTLEMPGTIVETSGRIEADNRTRWIFDASQAYPLGYQMSCRSLEPNAALIKKLLGSQPLDGRQSLLAYAEIVDGNESLRDVLKQCVKLNSMSPLEDFRVKIEAEHKPESAPVLQIQRLWKLLKLPD